MSDILPFARVRPADADLVGGKGLSLGLTAAAGLPVPAGLLRHHRRLPPARAAEPRIDAALAGALRGGLPRAGRRGRWPCGRRRRPRTGPTPASPASRRRSSASRATTRCGRPSSAAGGRSTPTGRRRTAQRQGVDEAGLAMAVVVQRLVDADVAGVLFTRDPLDPTGAADARRGVVGARRGGRVRPRARPTASSVDRDTGRSATGNSGHKHVRVTGRGEEPVPARPAAVDFA